MKKREIIGVILIVGGITTLSYLYNAYYIAYKEIKEIKTKGTTTPK
jgi:hypothetical protein